MAKVPQAWAASTTARRDRAFTSRKLRPACTASACSTAGRFNSERKARPAAEAETVLLLVPSLSSTATGTMLGSGAAAAIRQYFPSHFVQPRLVIDRDALLWNSRSSRST